MQAPRHLHLVAVRRIIRYLLGTSTRGLFFPSGSPIRVNAFSDSDWAGCLDTLSIWLVHVSCRVIDILEELKARSCVKIFNRG